MKDVQSVTLKKERERKGERGRESRQTTGSGKSTQNKRKTTTTTTSRGTKQHGEAKETKKTKKTTSDSETRVGMHKKRIETREDERRKSASFRMQLIGSDYSKDVILNEPAAKKVETVRSQAIKLICAHLT